MTSLVKRKIPFLGEDVENAPLLETSPLPIQPIGKSLQFPITSPNPTRCQLKLLIGLLVLSLNPPTPSGAEIDGVSRAN